MTGVLMTDLVQIVFQPLPLLFADHERRAIGVVESGHLLHALLGGGPAMESPLIGCKNGVQNDEMHALMVETVIMRAIEFAPIISEVEVIVMLAHDGVKLWREMGEDLRAMIEFVFFPQLRQVAAEDNEVGLGLDEIGFRYGALQTLIPVAHKGCALDLLDMRVRNIGETEIVARAAKSQSNHAYGKGC